MTQSPPRIPGRALPAASVAAGVALSALLVLDRVGLVSIVEFRRERIEVVVRPDRIEVSGLYVYFNPLPVPWTRGLKVPFPIDRDHRRRAERTAGVIGPV